MVISVNQQLKPKYNNVDFRNLGLVNITTVK
jgi:hypothetical protein